MNEPTPIQRFLLVARLIVAGALLLRLGGYALGVLPPVEVSLALLIGLIAAGSWFDSVAERGRDRAAAELRAWAAANSFWLGLAAIALLATVLRVVGIAQDLGHVAVGIDERRLNNSILHFFTSGEIDNSTVEHYPGIHYWLLTGTYLLTYLRGLMDGVATTLATMPEELFVAAGRLLSAGQSVVSVVLVGLLGRRLAGPAVGLWSAGIFALAPLSISLGRQLRNDTAQTALVVAAVLFALEVHRRDHPGYTPWLAGALAGLAAGVKYSGALALLPVVLAAVGAKDVGRRGRALVGAVTGFVVAVIASQHFVISRFPRFLYHLQSQVLITGSDHWAATDNPAAFHVMILATRVVGWPLLIVAAATLAYQLALGRWRWWVFVAFPVVYIGFVSGRPSQLPRWVFPSAPFIAIAAAAGVVALGALVARRLQDAGGRAARWAPSAATVTGLALVLPLAVATGGELGRRLATPTYLLAEEWLEENVLEGERVLAQARWLDIDDAPFDVRRVPRLDDWLAAGDNALSAHDWILVHEESLSHPALESLDVAATFRVETGLGGNQGPDFAVFAAPAVAPASGPIVVPLDAAEAAPYLGGNWTDDDPGPGRALPATGGGLFLPPASGRGPRRVVVLAAADPATELVIRVDGRRLRPVTEVTDRGTEYAFDLPARPVQERAVEILIRTAPRGAAVRLLELRVH